MDLPYLKCTHDHLFGEKKTWQSRRATGLETAVGLMVLPVRADTP
jgi:hypothetical protein